MEMIEPLFKTTIEEIERMLNSKTVVGEPITAEGNTIIPLVSVGFGFGACGGTGKDSSKGEGSGGGNGAGGGVKPVAVLVINKDGIRLEPVKSGTASLLEKVAETIGKTASRKEE